MSGRKRALLRMNERDRKKLKNIETRLGSVDVDFSKLQSRINEDRSQVSEQIESRRLEYDETLSNNISHLDARIQNIEIATQNALHEHAQSVSQVISNSNSTLEELRMELAGTSASFLSYIQQFSDDYVSQILQLNARFDDYDKNTAKQREIAWQNLSYSQEIYAYLEQLVNENSQYSADFNQIGLMISTGWTNFQNESYQAALMMAQQSVQKVMELRLRIESDLMEYQNLVFHAIERTTQVLELARNCQIVSAIDLEGNELDTRINVDYWTGGMVQQAQQTLSYIQQHLVNQFEPLDLISLTELLTQTLPEWETYLHEYVRQARIEVIAAQTRYEVAKTVVTALAEQGFELENGAFESGDMRLPYHVMLGNLEGSQVHISVSPVEENSLDYLLDIDSFDAEFRTESELRYRTRELLGSVESVGLRVGQVYQADQPAPRSIKEIGKEYLVGKTDVTDKQRKRINKSEA